MGRVRTTQDKPAGADEPRQTRKQTEPHRFLSFSFVLIYTVWQLEGNEVIADENARMQHIHALDEKIEALDRSRTELDVEARKQQGC